MKIAFYSTGGIDPSSPYSSRHFLFPRKKTEWDELADMFADDTICVYCTRSATHMIDIAGGELLEHSGKVDYIFLPYTLSVDGIADRIAADGVEIAIAYSLPDVTFDWYPVRDALVGEALSKRGVRVIAHPAKAAQDCLEKWTFQRILKENHFNYAKGVYIESEMFFSNRRYPMILNNVYYEYIRSRIEKLHFPVIIKSAAGSGSVGLCIAQNTDEVCDILLKREASNDVMVEEMLEGESFGVEIFGDPEGYHVSDPIQFSTGSNGITDPFSSIKFGPVNCRTYDVDTLKKELVRLAKILGLNGIAEADLIFSRGKWYILEINPRFSLLSQAVAIMENQNPFRNLMNIIQPASESRFEDTGTGSFVLDFKTTSFPDEKLLEIRKHFPKLRHVMRFQYGIPGRQGVLYCEWCLATDRQEEIPEYLKDLKRSYSEMVSDGLIENVISLIRKNEG